MAVPKLTTIAACRVAGLNRDRFNEHVAAGNYTCAPKTVPGRARLFDPNDMLTLTLFKRLMDDGVAPEKAGSIACVVGHGAKIEPEEEEIVFIETFAGMSTAYGAKHVPTNANESSGLTIYKKTFFNVAHLRKLIAHYTDEERSIIGPDDE